MKQKNMFFGNQNIVLKMRKESSYIILKIGNLMSQIHNWTFISQNEIVKELKCLVLPLAFGASRARDKSTVKTYWSWILFYNSRSYLHYDFNSTTQIANLLKPNLL